MGGHIAALQARIDNIAIFLGVGTFAKPCILKVGALGNQDILADADFGFDYRKTIQRRVVGNRYRRIQFDDIKNAPEVFFVVFHKIE